MKSLRLGLGLMLALMISTAVWAQEHYTCQNEAGFGTWKLEIMEQNPAGTIKSYQVRYQGYSVVTKGIGQWEGTGYWLVDSKISDMKLRLHDDEYYYVSCNQDSVQQNKWNCEDEEIPSNRYSIVCYPW